MQKENLSIQYKIKGIYMRKKKKKQQFTIVIIVVAAQLGKTPIIREPQQQ